MRRLQQWLAARFLGMEPGDLEVLRTLARGFEGKPKTSPNSLIIGGPTAWDWEANLAAETASDHHGDMSNTANFPGPHHHADQIEGEMTPEAHAAEHEASGSDEITLGSLAGTITSAHHGTINEDLHQVYYLVDGTRQLTAPLFLEDTAPVNEPDAISGNEGKFYYLTPAASDQGLVKAVMKNAAGGFERVQVAIST